jgi:hypothetical protein
LMKPRMYSATSRRAVARDLVVAHSKSRVVKKLSTTCSTSASAASISGVVHGRS